MTLIIGIILVLVTVGVIVGIGRIASGNIRNYDENQHENFLK